VNSSITLLHPMYYDSAEDSDAYESAESQCVLFLLFCLFYEAFESPCLLLFYFIIIMNRPNHSVYLYGLFV
jgi:hypothetical protein